MRTALTIGLVTLVGCQTTRVTNPTADRDCFTEVATVLSDDAFEGRGVGTEGLEKAAAYIQERFVAAGLGDGGVAYRQSFDVTVGVHLGDDNRLDDLELGTDFQPFGFSSTAPFEGDVVFAGYGIVAEDLAYDDYAGLDIEGKVVLAMRYEPQENDEDSRFDGRKPSRYSDIRYKALQARTRGARALVLVAPAKGDDDPDKVPALQSGGPTSSAGLPVIQVTRAVADRWLAGSEAPTLAELHATIDETGQPASRALARTTASGAVEIVTDQAPVSNVLGVIPGSGSLASEVVVVGAHYDHLGYGGQGSMRPDVRAIHNGADDNASGTAAMVCAMERLATAELGGDRRTIVGLAFTAEEIGLGGSAFYADNPVFPHERTTAMVNLDMVGRVRDGALQALGADTAPEWREILAPLGETHGLSLAMGGDGYGPSDHTSFYEKKLPVIHLFSGTHDIYHTPDDDIETLN
ncbi:MAG: M28 family peptidase, partial [Myxococcota bacterium]